MPTKRKVRSEWGPVGRPSTYDPAYCQHVIELGAEGKSPVQIAVAIGVLRGTMLGWADQHPEFSAALARAKEAEQHWWEEQGQRALFADRFQAAVWSKSMSARFRDDYTEKRVTEIGGIGGGAIKTETRVDVSQMTPDERAMLASVLAKAGVKSTDED